MQSIPTPGEVLDDAPDQVERVRERNETLELLMRFATLFGLIAAALIVAAILVRLSAGELTRL
jgi:hypothetical protein